MRIKNFLRTLRNETYLSRMFILKSFVLLTIFLVALHKSNFDSIQLCEGSSMSPNFEDGDVLLVFKKKGKAMIGDLVNFQDSDGDWVVKRVVGTEGMKFRFKNNHIIIDHLKIEKKIVRENRKEIEYLEKNGSALYYIKEYKNIVESTQSIKIPKNYVYVLGDNRSFSIDSRHYGPVNVSIVTPIIYHKLFNKNFN